MQQSETLASIDSTAFESLEQATAHHLNHPIRRHSQLASVVEQWAKAMPTSTNTYDDFDTHGSLLASLCQDLRPPETTPDGKVCTHWPEMNSRPIEHWFWPSPWLALKDEAVLFSPSPELAGDIQRYLSLGIRLPSVEALLLHACLYQHTVHAAWHGEIGPDAWWRRSIRVGASSASQYRWIRLTYDRHRSLQRRAQAVAGLWPILPAATSAALLWSVDWRIALVVGIAMVGVGGIAQQVRSAQDAAGKIDQAIDAMAHVCVLARSECPLAGSAHAVRESMYRTEALGADWPGVAYRLVERLIADQSAAARSP